MECSLWTKTQFLPSNDPRRASEWSNWWKISYHKSSSEQGNEVTFFSTKDFRMESSRQVYQMHFAIPCTQVHSSAMEIYIGSWSNGQKPKAYIWSVWKHSSCATLLPLQNQGGHPHKIVASSYDLMLTLPHYIQNLFPITVFTCSDYTNQILDYCKRGKLCKN